MTMAEAPGVATQGDRTERTINVRGIETHILEGGASTAPALLYLHGMSLGNLWLDYHKALAQNFHVIAPDIPGFGRTMRPDWMRDMSDYILYLRDLVETLGLEKPYVVGHSLGGWMAVELAVWYPEKVGKLVLSNAAGIRVKGSPIADIFAMNQQELVAALFDNPMAAMPLMPTEMSIDYFLQQYRERMTMASLAWNPTYDPKLERRLERVTAPTLIIWGENDRLIPAVYGDAYQAKIAGSELLKIAGTSHMPMFEKLDEWSKAVTNFLSK